MVLPPVTQADLDLIRDGRLDSKTGYLCVYERKRVGFFEDARYVAKCFKRPAGLLRTTPREAAKDVVRWWKILYGAEWYAYFLARRERGYKLIKDYGGWRIKAYFYGETIPIGGGQIGKVYPTKAEAKVAFRKWYRKMLGLFATKPHLFLRRKATRFPATRQTVGVR